MTANICKPYLGYLNKLVDESNNTYHWSKKSIHCDYSALTKKIESGHKSPEFKVGDRIRNTNYIYKKI